MSGLDIPHPYAYDGPMSTDEDQRRAEFRDGWRAGHAYADAVGIGGVAPANVTAWEADRLDQVRNATARYHRRLTELRAAEAERERLTEQAERTDDYREADDHYDEIITPAREGTVEAAVTLLALLGYGLPTTPAATESTERPITIGDTFEGLTVVDIEHEGNGTSSLDLSDGQVVITDRLTTRTER